MDNFAILRQSEACQHKKAAVLIGINYAGTSSALRGCEADVACMRTILQTRFGFSDITVMTQTSEATLRPTQQNILRVLRALAQRSRTDGVEQVVVQYSGHGTRVQDTSGDDETGDDQAIVDEQMQSITDDMLRSVLDQFSPWCRAVVVVDACHSGTGLDLPLSWPAFTPTIVKLANRSAPVANVLAIAGCADGETSADVAHTSANGSTVFGGAMTLALAECMFQSRDVFALMKNMDAWMRAHGYSQHPQLSSSRPLAAGDNLTLWLN